jgi:hypothetical protein
VAAAVNGTVYTATMVTRYSTACKSRWVRITTGSHGMYLEAGITRLSDNVSEYYPSPGNYVYIPPNTPMWNNMVYAPTGTGQLLTGSYGQAQYNSGVYYEE